MVEEYLKLEELKVERDCQHKAAYVAFLFHLQENIKVKL